MKKTIPILIVDDKLAILRSLTLLLRTSGYQSICTEHRSERVLDLVEKLQPALVLLDLHMPGLKGTALTRSIKQQNVNTKVIMVTADDSAEAKRQSLISLADGFLVKPIFGLTLLDEIDKVINDSPNNEVVELSQV